MIKILESRDQINIDKIGKKSFISVPKNLIKGEVKKPNCYKKYIFNNWTVMVDQFVMDKLYEWRKEKLPNETGGVLIGAFDFERKKCYVVDALPSPIDSKEMRCSYIRGTTGLQERVDKIKEITRDSLYYIGEWHSHTNDITLQSELDEKLMLYIVENNEKSSIPSVMAIAGETNISFYFEN